MLYHFRTEWVLKLKRKFITIIIDFFRKQRILKTSSSAETEACIPVPKSIVCIMYLCIGIKRQNSCCFNWSSYKGLLQLLLLQRWRYKYVTEMQCKYDFYCDVQVTNIIQLFPQL